MTVIEYRSRFLPPFRPPGPFRSPHRLCAHGRPIRESLHHLFRSPYPSPARAVHDELHYPSRGLRWSPSDRVQLDLDRGRGSRTRGRRCRYGMELWCPDRPGMRGRGLADRTTGSAHELITATASVNESRAPAPMAEGRGVPGPAPPGGLVDRRPDQRSPYREPLCVDAASRDPEAPQRPAKCRHELRGPAQEHVRPRQRSSRKALEGRRVEAPPGTAPARSRIREDVDHLHGGGQPIELLAKGDVRLGAIGAQV